MNLESDQKLLKAAASGDFVSARMSLEAGANPNALDEYGSAPLHLAAQGGYNEIINLLINCQANISLLNRDGWTALHFAARKGLLETSFLLLKSGVDVNVAGTRYGRTALHYASEQGHAKVVSVIIKAGANTEIKDMQGNTPLMLAQAKGHLEVTNLFQK